MLNYEDKQRYKVQITATSTSTLGDGSGTTPSIKSTPQLFYVDVDNKNEAPTGVSFTPTAAENFGSTHEIGTLGSEDEDLQVITGVRDMPTDTATFTLVPDGDADDTDGETTNTGLFEIGDDGELQFKDTDSMTDGVQFARKAPGETYKVRVKVTDGGDPVSGTPALTFIQILEFDENSVQVAGQYSSYVDASGNGLLPENAYIHHLGTVSFANSTSISLADDTDSNDNSNFFLMTIEAVPEIKIGISGGGNISQAVDSTNDGSKFVVLDIVANVVEGMELKAKADLEAGDLVVARLNGDADKLTWNEEYFTEFVLALADNTITMSDFAPGSSTLGARSDQLVYIGDNSGDFEADPPLLPLTVEVKATQTYTTSGSASLNAGPTTAGYYVYYHPNVSSARTLKAYETQAEAPSDAIFLGQVNTAGDGYVNLNTDNTGVTSAGNQIAVSNGATLIRRPTEKYIVRLSDVDE